MNKKILGVIDSAISELNENGTKEEKMVLGILFTIRGGPNDGNLEPLFNLAMTHAQDSLSRLNKIKWEQVSQLLSSKNDHLPN